MVRQDECPFMCSRWFIIIISVLTLLLSGLTLITSPIVAKDKNHFERDYYSNSLVVIVIQSIVGLCVGALGLYAAGWLKRIPMLIHAIIYTLSTVLFLLSQLIFLLRDGVFINELIIAVIVAAVSLPMVICSWIVFLGLSEQAEIGQAQVGHRQYGQQHPGYPQQGQQYADYPRQTQPQVGYPHQSQQPVGYPHQSQPQTGYQQQGQPQVGYPDQSQQPLGIPHQSQQPVGYPHQSQPQTGYPQQGQPQVGQP